MRILIHIYQARKPVFVKGLGAKGYGKHAKGSVPLQARKKITEGPVKLLVHMAFQVQSVGKNIVAIVFRHGHPFGRAGIQVSLLPIAFRRGAVVLVAQQIAYLNLADFVLDLRLEDVGLFVDVLEGREYVPGSASLGNTTPLNQGFASGLELVLIAEHNLRPVRHGQSYINEEVPNIQVHVVIKLEGRDRKGLEETARAVEVFSVLRIPGIHKSHVRLGHVKQQLIVLFRENSPPF